VKEAEHHKYTIDVSGARLDQLRRLATERHTTAPALLRHWAFEGLDTEAKSTKSTRGAGARTKK
jgi:hypothetical protein